jgi:hypothetical protein
MIGAATWLVAAASARRARDLFFWALPPAQSLATSIDMSVGLLTAPLEVHGPWASAAPGAAEVVITRMREACLEGIALRSDHQPKRLRVDNHDSGLPAIWLHDDPPHTAWIIVNVGPRDWCKLAYQFGHELGHVLCNSWQRDAKPARPCQWLEEALVEALSVFSLARLADRWERDPPFVHDENFADAIRNYRAAILERYTKLALDQGAGQGGMRIWFAANRGQLEEVGALSQYACAAVPAIVAVLHADRVGVEDFGALNRWDGRSGIDLESYLAAWTKSCSEIGCAGILRAAIESWLRP